MRKGKEADNWFVLAVLGEDVPPETGVTTEDGTVAAYEDRVVANDFDLGFVGHPPTSADLEGEQFLEDEIFFGADRMPFVAAPSGRARPGSASSR